MAIQRPILDAPAVTRGQVKTVIGLLTNAAPPETAIVAIDGTLQAVEQLPMREGQMAFTESEDGLSVIPYIVVAIPNAPPLNDSTLEWRRVFSAGEITDPRTGQPKDPLYNFY